MAVVMARNGQPTSKIDIVNLAPPSDCPTLPREARLDARDGQDAGAWLDVYTDYAKAVAPMTPPQFQESAGLWLGSTVIARRLKVAMPFAEIYPNLAIGWLAPTTLWSKTTALDLPKGIARRTFPHLLAPQDVTLEALISDLAGSEPPHLDSLPEEIRQQWRAERNYAAQKGWLLDEMSGLLASAGRDYNGGLVEALLRFYDCEASYTRSTRAQGRITVRHAYLSLLGASTPLAMSSHLVSDRLWAMGWWPRFALLTPEAEYPEWAVPLEMDEPAVLAEHLRELDQRLPAAQWPEPPAALSVALGADVFPAWERYTKAVRYDLLRHEEIDDRLKGTYGRLPVQVLKVATILAAFDWRQTQRVPCIEYPHLVRAVTIVEGWRASAHRTLTQVTQSDFDTVRQRIIRQTGRKGDEGITLRDLSRMMKDKPPDQIADALRQLVEVGDLEMEENVSRGGRATDRYFLPKRTSE